MGMWAGLFLPISAGSMSTWMKRARGANSERRPVTRSSNLAPTARITSASLTAQLAAAAPCIPSMPRQWGLLSSTAPLPISVTVTGIRVDSMSLVSSGVAPPLMTPPPA